MIIKNMNLTLSFTSPSGMIYQTGLWLPAEDYEIKDAMQRLRAVGRENMVEIKIYECDIMPWLERVRLDSARIDEMNFFIKRLASFPDEKLPVFYAVTRQIVNEANNSQKPVSVKDLVNSTYILDAVPAAQNTHYELPEVYDGVTLPYGETQTNDFIIRVLVSGTREHNGDDFEEKAIWLNLPMETDLLNRYAGTFNEKSITDCLYQGIDSVIPQINIATLGGMKEINNLNVLALCISTMSETDRIKFKAVLEAEKAKIVKDALDVAHNLDCYEFDYEPDDPDIFIKKYLLRHMDARLDSKWIDKMFILSEGNYLLKRLGAAQTHYGVVSARNGHLYEPVPYYEPKAEEKLDVIEILGRRALFSNGRLMPEEIPEGLYAYDLRHNNDGGHFCSIEPNVRVNHGGTVLMKDILDFGRSGYIPLDEDTEPNFLGETMTATEFAEEEAQDETMQMGGI